MRVRSLLWTAILVLGFVALLSRATVAEGPSPRQEMSIQDTLGTAFTYQGQLREGGGPVNGTCDLVFKLYDAASAGGQVGTALTSTIAVNSGLFTAQLDFGGGIFSDEARWLEVAVRCPAGSGDYTALSPRQALTAAPYALALPGLWTQQNITSPNLLGGYNGNTIISGVVGAAIGGGGDSGYPNRVTDDYGTVGGGKGNLAGDNAGSTYDNHSATVAGGYQNTASGGSTVGGGKANTASSGAATVGGGTNNMATAPKATVGGGEGNIASGTNATVGGGGSNIASRSYATVGGGYSNGASGGDATVPGGRYNTASGAYSFAGGRRAKANHQGAFVWGDSTNADIASSASNQFIVRANGGIWFGTATADFTPTIGSGVFISTSTGTYLSTGGAWTNASDRAAKADFAPVDGEEVLARLAEVPIATWNYIAQDPSIRHMGPAAQDFYAAFGLGEDELHIATIDADGVALAAIQGLYQLSQEQAARISELEAQNAAQEEQIAALEARLAALEALVARQAQGEMTGGGR